MKPHDKFVAFLESIYDVNPSLINGIKDAYNVINGYSKEPVVEATEDVVDDIEEDLLAGLDFTKMKEQRQAMRSEKEAELADDNGYDYDDPEYAEMIAGLGYGELGRDIGFVLDKMAVLNGRREQDYVNRLHSLLRHIEIGEDITENEADELGMIVEELKALAKSRISGPEGDSDEDDEDSGKKITNTGISDEELAEMEKLGSMKGSEAADELERLLAEKDKELENE